MLTVTSVNSSEQWYRYRAVVTNMAGSVTSASAALVVGGEPPAFSPPLLRPIATAGQLQPTTGAAVSPTDSGVTGSVPQVMDQPLDQTVGSDGTATFAALASGEPVPTVQWQVSTDGGKTFSDIAGAAGPSLTLNPAVTSEPLDRYRAVFTNSAGSDTSASASVIFAS